MLKIHRTSQFKKHFKKAIKSVKEIDLLIEIIEKLPKKETLPPKIEIIVFQEIMPIFVNVIYNPIGF
jgi:mRNA interferase YafQ